MLPRNFAHGGHGFLLPLKSMPRRRLDPEEIRVTGMDGDFFRGVILNKPHKLQSVDYGREIRFMVAEGAEFPIMVTDRYLEERPAWIIHPCDSCGLSEMFDAPSDYFRAAFPDAPADGLAAFTAFCPLCSGIQGIEEKKLHKKLACPEVPGLTRAKPWWQFWN